MGTFKETFKSEMEAQKAAKLKAKEDRKKERDAKGPLIFRLFANAKSIGIAGIYSIAYALFVYCAVLFITMYLPTLLGAIVSFFNAETSIVLTVECSCLFFTAWIFVLSFAIVKQITKVYTRSIRHLFQVETK